MATAATQQDDLSGKIKQMQLENRPYDYMLGLVAVELQKRLGMGLMNRKDYEDMARNVLDRHHVRDENTQPKEKTFTYESNPSPSKQEPECATTWSKSWTSEEGEASKPRQPSVPRQRTRVPQRSPLLKTSVNQKVKSPKRRGRSPARSPNPRTATNLPPQQDRSRSRNQSYREPNLGSEHVSTRSSKSPIRSRSPYRAAAGQSSPSVYYDCESTFTQFRDNDSPKVARDARSHAAVRDMNESMENLFVDAGNSPGFQRSLNGLNTSVQNISFNDRDSSSQEPFLNSSFQQFSLEEKEKKFSFDESSGRASAGTGVSPRQAKMEPKTPMGTSNTAKCPSSEEMFSPYEDTPASKHPEVGTNTNASSPHWGQPTSSTKTQTDWSKPRSPNTTTYDLRTSPSASNHQPTPPGGLQNDSAMPFASPVPEFQAPHQVFAESEPRGWRNVRPSPQPYMDANSPSFPNGCAQNIAQDPPAPTASSNYGAANPATNGQTTAGVQFNVNLEQKIANKTKAKRRVVRRAAGNARRSDKNVKPTSFDPASSMGANNSAQASTANPSPPEPMDCGTPAPSKNLNDIRFNIGVTDKKSTASKHRTKKRDVKHTPVPMQTQQDVPIQFNIGVGDTSKNSKSRLNKSKRSQSAYYPSERAASSSQFGKQDRTFSAQDSNAATIRAMNEAAVLAHRDEAEKAYINKDYKEAVLNYSEAISLYKANCRDFPIEKLPLAVLFSKRADCLMNLGAYRAATGDCEQGLTIMPSIEEVAFADYIDSSFKAALLCQMARGFLQLGDDARAENLFNLAEEDVQQMSIICSKHADPKQVNRLAFLKVSNEIGNGIMDIGKFREAMKQIERFNKNRSNCDKARKEVLGHVNFALGLANGCDELHHQKISLLAILKRWREIESHCGRLAASRTKLDGCFVQDLASKNPFVGVEQARVLKNDSFKDADENDLRGAARKLTPKCVAEAVLRLPHSIIPYYARSLRLEESYHSERLMLEVLQDHIAKNTGAYGVEGAEKELDWLSKERDMLNLTKQQREEADKLFRNRAYNEAAARYEYCLNIDPDAGGRLHAVLHCNRAACFIELKRYHEAAAECTAALRIHEWYMRAILRRARCYANLDRYDESIAEFKRWIELFNRAREGKLHFSQGRFPCIFEGPEKATDDDLRKTERELQSAIRAKDFARAQARSEASWKQNPFNNNEKKGDAERRRENFYSQKNDSRRWDSFSNRGPKRSHSKPRTKASSQSKDSNRYSYKESNTSSNSYNRSQNSRPVDVTENSDHYSLLGVSRNATEAEIKKAFRKGALKYHPDKNKDKDAADIFRRMKTAHDELMDPQKRREYNLTQQFGGGSCRW